MGKTRHILFFTRLLLYLLAFSLPVIHPSIAVPYDRTGWWLWFALVPGEMLIAFYFSPPRFRFKTWVLSACALISVSIIFISGFSSASFIFMAAGTVSFLLTVLIFKTGALGQRVAVLEQFFLGMLYYKMLCFSRASESIARENSGLTQLILVIIVCAFLFHGLVIYLSAFEQGSGKRGRRELLLFLSAAVPVLLVIAFILPPDFVKHSMVLNRINRDVSPRPIPLDESGDGLEGGNLQARRLLENERFKWGQADGLRSGEREGNGDGEEPGQNALEGLPADQWGNQMGGEGESKQYAVMAVASPVDPVYAAEAYFGDFDPVRGFFISKEESLNELTYLRFVETWRDMEYQRERKRYPFDIFYLSTLSDRVLAYKPFTIEPTVLQRKYHPFNFSYCTVSKISRSQRRDWLAIEDLNPDERNSLMKYLEIPLEESVLPAFESYLEQAVAGKTGYYERIEAVLKSFSSFQYKLGFKDDVSVSRLKDFLMRTREGDCTEFSNTTAILARLAGIPSRVVTGYLASRNLQTRAHRRGIRILQDAIEPLREFPLNNLYLVTTAHHHSWVQLYMPGYGWVDFETTAHAIPPLPGGDANSMDVVIPLIQDQRLPEQFFRFPWLMTLRVLFCLLFVGIILTYIYRYGKEIYFHCLLRDRNIKALKALFKLLLIKLSVNGYTLKPPCQTALEYSSVYPELRGFASLYTMLRYREKYEPGEWERSWDTLQKSYLEILKSCRKPGLWNLLRRLFGLKCLYY